MRSTRALAALGALLLLGAVPPSAVASDSTGGWSAHVETAPQPSLSATSTRRVSERLREYTFSTRNIPGTSTVRVLLPAGYSGGTRRYPVLLLLDGCCNTAPQARDWTTPATMGDAEGITADADLITVMPDAGLGGQYTDWVRPGAQGQPQWESYLIGQLLPWVDATFRTRGARSGRAVAGLSMGGFGALSLAARHPDLFTSATSFSGIVDSNVSPQFVQALTALDGGLPDSAFGDRTTEQVRWRAHNPADLVGNLRGLTLSLYTGNGHDDQTGRIDPVESLVHEETLSLDAALTSAGIAHSLEDYGSGTHTWPYWNRDLRRVLPRILNSFGAPTDPDAFDHTSASLHFSVYGYRVRVDRAVREFVTLSGVTGRGFRLSGSGTARVVTAPRYAAGRRYRITGGGASRTVTADRRGRLTLTVALCPANSTDQYSAAPGAARHTCTSLVRIT